MARNDPDEEHPDEEHADGSDPEGVTELFQRYVRARDRGESADVDGLLDKAGQASDQLADRIRRFDEFERVAGEISGATAPIGGERLGRFRLIRMLGHSASKVYLARDPELKREVALKIVDRSEVPNDEARRWALREARSLARIEHPHVLRVFEVTQAGEALVVVAEHLSGPSLAEVLAEMRRASAGQPAKAPEDEADRERRRAARAIADRLSTYSARAKLAEALADALATCHDSGILHRDIKPANVVFDRDGRPKLIDFGLAHMEEPDEETSLEITVRMMGTPAYLAPEQVDQERTGADPRSDQFSFGVLLYELLTLKHPFHRETRERTLDAISRCLPKPPRELDAAIPRDLGRVVLHSLERDPARRYASLGPLAADLRAVLEHRPISLAEPGLSGASLLWLKRNRKALALGAGAAAIAALSLIGLWLALARGDRAAISRSLAAAEAEDLTATASFERALQTLSVTRATAARFDASPARRALFSAQGPRIERALDTVTRRLGETVWARYAADGTTPQPETSRAWSRVIDRALALSPDCEHLAPVAGFGKTLFPSSEEHGVDAELYAWVPSDTRNDYHRVFSVLRPVGLRGLLDGEDQVALDPGYYRYLAHDTRSGAVVLERDFVVVPGWHDLMVIEPGLRSQETFGTAQTFGTARPIQRKAISAKPFLREDQLVTPEQVYNVAAFRVSERLVTRREFEAFLRERGDEFTPYPEWHDEPMLASQKEALAFCAAVGGRLPTVLELHAYAEETGEKIWSGESTKGEWVSDIHGGARTGVGSYLLYEKYSPDDTAPIYWLSEDLHPWTSPIYQLVDSNDRSSGVTGAGFRVAFTTDTKDGLELAGTLERAP